jgi:hypothetical protein
MWRGGGGGGAGGGARPRAPPPPPPPPPPPSDGPMCSSHNSLMNRSHIRRPTVDVYETTPVKAFRLLNDGESFTPTR